MGAKGRKSKAALFTERRKGTEEGGRGTRVYPSPQTPPSIWRNCINRNIITELWNPANIARQKCFNEKGSYSKSCFENISISVICICLVSLSTLNFRELRLSTFFFRKKWPLRRRKKERSKRPYLSHIISNVIFLLICLMRGKLYSRGS